MRLRGLFISLMLLCYSCVAEGTPSSSEILNYVQGYLSPCGVLKNLNGFVYVDVDDAYVHSLIAFIQKEGYEEPPYFGTPDLVGAHITVIYPGELKKAEIGKIQEYGEMIYFTPKECQVVHPPKWKEIECLYLLVVEAPELDRIRKKYGLPKREYDFHITLGVRPKCVKAA